MSEHAISAVVAGHGIRVIPARLPCSMTSVARSRTLDVRCEVGNALLSARIEPTQDTFAFQLGTQTPQLGDVAYVEAGPDRGAWWIETARCRSLLPEGWTLHCGERSDDLPVFDLLGPDQATIVVRMPRRMPSLHHLSAPGQQFRNTGQLDRGAWLELEFERAGRGWTQRHELFHRDLTAFVVSLQTPDEHLPQQIATLASFVESVQLQTAGSDMYLAR